MKTIYLILTVFLLSSCNNNKKEYALQDEECNKDSNIKYKYDSITFWLIKDYQNSDLKNAEITYIHKNKRVKLNYNLKQQDSKIMIKNIDILQSQDTIKILLNSKNEIKVTNFRNGPIYGGKNFLGCVLSGYSINNLKRNDAMHGTITVF